MNIDMAALTRFYVPRSQGATDQKEVQMSKPNTARHCYEPIAKNPKRQTPPELFVPNPKLRLRQQVREVMRFRHYSVRTEETYWGWIRQFIFFHDKRHPREMGDREVHAFLTHLAAHRNVAVSTQNQALNALVFLYAQVLSLIHISEPTRLLSISYAVF